MERLSGYLLDQMLTLLRAQPPAAVEGIDQDFASFQDHAVIQAFWRQYAGLEKGTKQ